MQHSVVDQTQLQTDLPMPPAGADNEQISAGRGFQECPSRRAFDHLAAHRHVTYAPTPGPGPPAVAACPRLALHADDGPA